MDTGIYYEYEQILLNKKKYISSYYFTYTDKVNEKNALKLFKYAFEYYLQWSPEDLETYLTMDIIKQLKLDSILTYIKFPAELDPNKDLFYIVYLIYPNKIEWDAYEATLKVYEKVLRGDLKKFPKEYLSEAEGFLRACICLQYMLIQNYSNKFRTIKDIYYMFSEPEGIAALKKYRLYSVYTDTYDNPVDYIHDSLSVEQKDDFYHNFYYFKNEYNNYLKEIKKEKLKQKKLKKEIENTQEEFEYEIEETEN